MILIFGEGNDISTDKVAEWLQYFNVPFFRFNEESANLIDDLSINQNGVSIKFNCTTINLEEITSIWFRRGFLRYRNQFINYARKNIGLSEQVHRNIEKELQTFSDFVYTLFGEKYVINYPKSYNTNKLETLYFAQKLGLQIPETLVTKNAIALSQFKNQCAQGVITKPLYDNVSFNIGNKSYGEGTSEVQEIESDFYYSLFQQKVQRYCEVRTFFIEDDFFSMAIFVDSSIVDGRHLKLGGKRARMVSFQLPNEITELLKKLIKMKGINCGSIDMIMTKEAEFYFLELNPVGQYDYVEYYCNYPISKTIAEKLINNGKAI